MSKRQGTFIDWASNATAHGLISAAKRLPYEKRVPFMGAVMRRGVGPLAGFRKRAEANLAAAYPEWDADELRRVADGVCDNFGRTVIENYSYDEFNRHLAATKAAGDGLADVARAHADGRPVLFVNAHFGNHEAPRHVLTRMGYNIGGLYRPFTNPYFDAHYKQTLSVLGGPVFEQGKRGTIGLIKHLRAGNMGTLFFDVHIHDAPIIPFMGRPAHTATSAAEIALKLDALILPYFGTRRPDGLTFDIEIQSPIAAADPVTMTQEMTARLEAKIQQTPEQWFWVHRRRKAD